MKRLLSSLKGAIHHLIQAAIFRKHVQATHPSITSNGMPPDHTLTRGEVAAMLAKVVVMGVCRIVARGARDLTNYSILYFSQIKK